MTATALFVLAALGLHGILMVSILDIYFRSPVVHGMTAQRSPLVPPAKRLVLISSDGLRADKFFEAAAEEPSHAPFLRRLLTTGASWGVSHTRVPTESRPGHVAMIGGFYEDPSALLSGWQENPVPFDTVWNESRYTWQIGSPDVIPMFGEGAPHVESHHFPTAWINFSGDPRGVDTWVCTKTIQLLKSSDHNTTLYSLLMSDKIVFFLHLLGMDTAGHQFRPQSPKYIEAIRNVDIVVEKLYGEFERFWPDKRTAYIFTSDHGMSNRGSHGDGSVDETRCPLMAWGAGVASPKERSSDRLLAAQSLTQGMVWLDGAFESVQKEKTYVQQRWRLNPEERVDILQADLAPLMATLIGVPLPVNSIGVLNTDYLNGTERFKAISLLTNAQQVLQQCLVLAGRRKAGSHLRYVEFPGLSTFNASVDEIYHHLNHSRFAKAHNVSRSLAQDAYQCVTYYHKYDWRFLREVIAGCYVLWIACAVLFVLVRFGGGPLPARNTHLGAIVTFPTLMGLMTYLVLQTSPASHYIYCAMLVGLLAIVSTHFRILWKGTLGEFYDGRGGQRSSGPKAYIETAQTITVHIFLLELMVYGFYQRTVYSVAFGAIGLGISIPFLSHAPGRLRAMWLSGCLALTPYPLLAVDAGSWPSLGLAAVALAIGLAIATAKYFTADLPPVAIASAQRQLHVQLACVAVQWGVCYVSDVMLRQQTGLPLANRLIAWGCIVISLATLAQGSPTLLLRCRSVVLALLPLHVALSVAYESLVYVKLASLLLFWLKVTTLAPAAPSRHCPVRAHLGCALLFFFWMNAAFFTTGNLASISSFELSSVYRLTTQFDPAFMALLLVLKNMVPWMAVVTPFVAFMRLQGQDPLSLFALTFVYSDAMALHFFFLVQDSGSWKDIGHSISRFGIANCTILVILLLSSLCSLLLRPSYSHHPKTAD